MAITIAGNFQLTSSLPLDNRTSVANYVNLSGIQAPYTGMIVFVNNDENNDGEQSYYKYNSNESWTRLDGISGSGSVGNADTADKLATAVSINGTSFDGTGDITTSYWGTARTITIGNSAKSVNGSADVSYTLSEIGVEGNYLPLTGGNITGTLYFNTNNGSIYGSNGSLYINSGEETIFENTVTFEESVAIDDDLSVSGTVTGTFSGNLTGNASTATKLATARTIALSGAAIGEATSFDGSANITIPVTTLDASKLTGEVPISVLPQAALERVKIVASDTTRFSLTVDDVQLGDTVKVTSTGLMYLVVDTENLDSEDGYVVYTAGSAATATQLETARKINGTSFDGTGDITTSYWGTARTITIGNSAKSVNGNANVSYSLSEIGAAASDHNHDDTYLKLTGGNITGTLYFNTNNGSIYGSNGSLYINSGEETIFENTVTFEESVAIDDDLSVSGTVTGSSFIGKLNGSLTNPVNVNGISADLSTDVINYSTCPTAAATAAKVVDLDNFELTVGARVSVKFTYTNSASNPTLNVNETGAKAIYYDNAAITASYLQANKILDFIYDGTNYVYCGYVDTNTDTHYSAVNYLGTTGATANATAATTNTTTFLTLRENNTTRSNLQIKGAGSTTVSAVNGVLTITSVDTDTTYDAGDGLALTDTTFSLGTVTKSATTSTASPAHSGTFTAIDSITTDSYGRVTGVNTKTITLPDATANTDTKVTNTLATTTKAYITGTTSSTTNTGTQVFDTGVYLDTTAGVLHATSLTASGVSSATLTTTGDVSIGGDANIYGLLDVSQDVTVTGTLTAETLKGSLSTDYLTTGDDELIIDCGNATA